jgi:hypothetical protein
MSNFNTEAVNVILSFALIMIVCAALVARESIQALEIIAEWATARAWGLKCMERQKQEFRNKQEQKA